VTSKGALIRRAGRVWISTGTPIVNWPDELWTHVSRLWPDLCEDAPTYDDWRDRFCHVTRTDYGEQVVGGKNPVELARRLQAMGSRLRLVDAVDMPELLVDQEAVSGREIDLRLLDPQIAAEVEVIIRQQAGEDWNPEMLERQLGSPVATMRRLIVGAKVPAVVGRVMEEIQGGADRVLVFGCHVTPLAELTDSLCAQGVVTATIVGSTPPTTRDKLVQMFNAGEIQVLAGNIMSMGTGLNLQACRRAIFLDASWSPAQNAQAIGRIFRAGQTRPCHTTFFSLAGSVDENVQRVLARKARFISKLEGWQ
jgi:SNF2 family DNA or RNA helicase